MKTTSIISLLIALVAINQVFILTPSFPQNIYYVLLGLGLIIGLFLSKKISINWLMIWLLFAASLSLALNNVPAFFQAPLRLMTFLLVVAFIGPFLGSDSLNEIRQKIFSRINLFLIVLASLSFLVFALRLPVPQARGFSGFFNHSMMLGPMAGIALLLLFHEFIKYKSVQVIRRKKQLLYVAIVFCFLSLLLAGSRAAIAGAAVGLVFFFYKIYQSRISKFVSVIVVVVSLIVMTYPAWSDYTESIQRKQSVAKSQGDLASSRRSYWDARLEEFNSSPIVGIGFATLDASKQGSNVRKDSGGIEPGTSWLTILSMVGILGFIPVFLIFMRNFIFLLRDRYNPLKSAALGGLLLFFVTHMFAEGYIFASGGFLFFYIWLLLGVLEIYRKNLVIEIV